MNPDKLPLPDSIFATVKLVTAALNDARRRGPDPDGGLVIRLPDEFALLRGPEGLAALHRQRNDLLCHAAGLHSAVVELVHVVAGIQFGDALSAGVPRTNPELVAWTRETALRVRGLCGESLRAARLLRGYDTLGHLLHGAAEADGRSAVRTAAGPAPADAPEEMRTTPADAKELGLPSVTGAFEDMARALEKALAAPNAGGTCRVALPTRLRPQPFAEGMREAAALSEQALRSTGELSLKLRDLCVTVIRAELGEIAATGSGAGPEFSTTVRLTGYASTVVLEDVCRAARQLEQQPAVSELLGGSKPTR